MKLFVAQINPTPGAVDTNLQNILGSIDEAKTAGAELIVFPEFVLSGAPLHDLLFHQDFIGACEQALQRIAKATKGISVIMGSPATDRGLVFDSAILYNDGKEIGRQHHTFSCWNIGSKRIAVLVGEVKPSELPENTDLLVHIAASPWSVGHPENRCKAISNRALHLKVPYLFVNLVGGNDGWIFDGNSLYCDATGSIIWQAKAFQPTLCMVEKNTLTPPSGMEEVHQALLLGISDYFRKQGTQKAHVALSGGIDSSVTACLVTQALGPSRVQGVFLPYKFTSDESKKCVELLTKNIKIPVQTIAIDPIVETSFSTLSASGLTPEGLVYENLQSRLRSVLLMALSNAANSMLVATGNKTEVTLGYATIYGDLCGALLPLGDLFKTEVYELAKHINKQQPTIPNETLQRAPTAELTPGQHDSDDLPEYSILDPVLRALVLEGRSPEDIAAKTGMDINTIYFLTQKMWRAEYKHRQGPCILRTSSRAFGCEAVYPITNSFSHKSSA